MTQNIVINPVFNNVVAKDVQSMFLSLNPMSKILLCPNFTIKNDVIQPNSLLTNLLSIISSVTLPFLFICSTYVGYRFGKYWVDSNFLDFILIYECVMYSFGFIINRVLELNRTKIYIDLVLTFQRLHEHINDRDHFKRFKVSNWIVFVVTHLIFIIYFYLICTTLKMPYFYAMRGHVLVVIDFKLLYIIRLIKLLKSKVVLWIDTLVRYKGFSGEQRKCFCKKMFEAYVDLLRCYDTHKYCSQEIVSRYCY